MRDRAAVAITAERAEPTAHAVLEELFTETEIAVCLRQLKNRKAAGPDGLLVELLK